MNDQQHQQQQPQQMFADTLQDIFMLEDRGREGWDTSNKSCMLQAAMRGPASDPAPCHFISSPSPLGGGPDSLLHFSAPMETSSLAAAAAAGDQEGLSLIPVSVPFSAPQLTEQQQQQPSSSTQVIGDVPGDSFADLLPGPSPLARLTGLQGSFGAYFPLETSGDVTWDPGLLDPVVELPGSSVPLVNGLGGLQDGLGVLGVVGYMERDSLSPAVEGMGHGVGGGGMRGKQMDIGGADMQHQQQQGQPQQHERKRRRDVGGDGLSYKEQQQQHGQGNQAGDSSQPQLQQTGRQRHRSVRLQALCEEGNATTTAAAAEGGVSPEGGGSGSKKTVRQSKRQKEEAMQQQQQRVRTPALPCKQGDENVAWGGGAAAGAAGVGGKGSASDIEVGGAVAAPGGDMGFGAVQRRSRAVQRKRRYSYLGCADEVIGKGGGFFPIGFVDCKAILASDPICWMAYMVAWSWECMGCGNAYGHSIIAMSYPSLNVGN